MASSTDAKELLALAIAYCQLHIREALALGQALRDIELFCKLSQSDLEQIIARRLRRQLNLQDIAGKAEADLTLIREYNSNVDPCLAIKILIFDDPDYPRLLKEIYDPPYLLFIKGSVAALGKTSIAIVGSRSAEPKEQQEAYALALGLGNAGLICTSGLARGIDTAANTGNLHSLSPSIAVLGSGFSYFFPQENTRLAEQILWDGGSLVSEFAPSVPPLKRNFPKRNRLISGLNKLIIVCGIPRRSGALITVNSALEQGRDVYALGASVGCLGLEEQGALRFNTYKDLLLSMDIQPPEALISLVDLETLNSKTAVQELLVERSLNLLHARTFTYRGQEYSKKLLSKT